MPTTLQPGQESIWIESQSPGPGWILAKLKNNPKITSEEIDIIDRTNKRSKYIWQSDEPLMSINNRQIFQIPKAKELIEAQKSFLENEADKCYDKNTIQPLLPEQL